MLRYKKDMLPFLGASRSKYNALVLLSDKFLRPLKTGQYEKTMVAKFHVLSSFSSSQMFHIAFYLKLLQRDIYSTAV